MRDPMDVAVDRMLFSSDKIPPVDPEQFAFALQVASAAFDYLVPMKSPAATGVLLELPSGETQHIVVRDTPEARYYSAIRDHFAPDRATAVAAMIRSTALQQMWDSKRMNKWLSHPDVRPGEVRVDDAVFYAAATLPLTSKRRFNEKMFFDKVEELARSMAAKECPPSRNSSSD